MEYNQWRTSCPECGNKELIVFRVTLVAAGYAIHPNSRLCADGFVVDPEGKFEKYKDLSTEDEKVFCPECGEHFDLSDLELKENTIQLPCFGIVVTLSEKDPENPARYVGGTIKSDLHIIECDSEEYNAAIDGLESLILAHACAGIDISTPAYIEGIETAEAAIGNHFG